MHSTGPLGVAQRVAPQAGATLTHFSYSLHCSRIALERQEVARVYVQFRRAGATCCGLVKQCRDVEGKEFFLIESAELGDVWRPCATVRLCSGDGLCRCESERDPAAGQAELASALPQRVAFFQAGVVAPPERSTGGTRAV